MENKKETKYLSEVINYKEDIAPYRLIQIYSGVGSGKNYWVQTLAEQGKNILFITSRKITAEVQDENIRGIKVDLDNWHRHTINGEPVGGNQYVVSRTNAWIAYFARNTYDPEDTKTHIWKYFDYIFLDEAHSVVTDATFADSSFQVWRFMAWVAAHKSFKCKVILMSGTPEPIQQLIPIKTREKEWFKYLDYFEQCNHVEPKAVIIRHENKPRAIAKEIIEYYEKDERIIYFASSITNMKYLVEDLLKQGIAMDDIGISFTDESHNGDFDDKMIKRKETIEDCLKTIEYLPDYVRIFLTTTKNKEGINIQNGDIKVMFAESSQRAELVQMAGRVRSGLDELIVMYNMARNYNDVRNKWRRDFAKESLDHVYNVYNSYIEGNKLPTPKQIIADIEESFPYMRYDFFQQKFLVFDGRIKGEDLVTKDSKKLAEWIESWNDERVIDSKGIILPSGETEFKKEWFPYSIVSLAEKPPTDMEIAKNVMDNYFKEHSDLFEKIISKDERDKIVADLNVLLKERIDDYKEYSQANSLLKKGGYEVVEAGKHGSGNYRIQLIEADLSDATKN